MMSATSFFPSVAVVVPTKDRPQFARHLFEQYERQDYANKSLIIVQDGICDWRDLLSPRPDIAIIDAPGTRGQKLNIAAENTSAEIIACFDDDDWHASTRISEQVNILRESGKQVVAQGDMIHYVPATRRVYRWTAHGPGLPGASMLYSREYAVQYPWTAKPIGADGVFSREAIRNGVLEMVTGKIWTVAREHPGNSSRRDIAYLAETTEQVQEIAMTESIRSLLIGA